MLSVGQAMIEENNFYKEIFENTSLVILLVDPCTGEIIDANKAASSFYGYTQEEFSKMNISQINTLSMGEIRKKISQVITSEKSKFEFEHRLKNGEIRNVEVNCGIAYRQGKSVLYSLVSDVSEKHELYEIVEHEKQRTEFFANISHEFKTPLHVIFSSIQLLKLQSQIAEPDGKKGILDNQTNIMIRNCYRLMRLTNNLLDITKIDAGYYELNIKPHNIGHLIKGIIENVKEYIQNTNKRIDISNTLKTNVLPIDKRALERIVLNLLSNSIKFTDNNGKIDVELYEDAKNIFISIKDNGIGMEKRDIESSFKRFKQVDKSFTRQSEGVGIGLTVVKSFVDILNGEIFVMSEKNKGSEFIVKLKKDNEWNNYDNVEYLSQVVSEDIVQIELSDIL